MTLFVQPLPPLPPVAPLPPLPQTPPIPEIVIGQSGPPEVVLLAGVSIVAIIVAGVVFWPLIRAWARRIEGKTADQGLALEVDQLRSRVAELEQVQHRVAELEERVDFSERLLTQGREPAQVDRRER